ncbi:hypothetical protein PGO_126570 [Plasmodium gonderi]|uniref:Uncharacterized protein n=1 Tax=Plasmodium gonderi TaxID=77519 RepID=A0A1Y1JJI1_PLAGO|nr:hypothetical protein PGO_126570 [Plasmodium gonderi]GAW82659.1 hypothetical protein PGO_126570 [Plasmodium gonderi]
MLMPKCFTLIPAEDKNLENLVNELSQSKKSIRKIQNYGALERSSEGISIYGDNGNIKIQKLIIPTDAPRQNVNTKIKECSFRKKENSTKKYSAILFSKNTKSTLDFNKDTNETKLNTTNSKFDLSNIKENMLFQRIFKTIEKENIKTKNEKLKDKSEKLKHLNQNFENQNAKRKNLNEENKDHLTESIIQFKKVLNDKKKTYSTLKIKTRRLEREIDAFTPYPDKEDECYNTHIKCENENSNSIFNNNIDKRKEKRSRIKTVNEMENKEKSLIDEHVNENVSKEKPYQKSQEKYAKKTTHRKSNSDKEYSSIIYNGNNLIYEKSATTSHLCIKHSNVHPQKVDINEDTYHQFSSADVIGNGTYNKRKKVLPKHEERSKCSSTDDDKLDDQYYIHSCRSNFSETSYDNYTKHKNNFGTIKKKGKMYEQVNEENTDKCKYKDRNGRRRRRRRKKKKKKKIINPNNKMFIFKNTLNYINRDMFQNSEKSITRAPTNERAHHKLNLIQKLGDENVLYKWDSSYYKKFQYIVLKKKRKKRNVRIFSQTIYNGIGIDIGKYTHATKRVLYKNDENARYSFHSEYVKSVKEDYHDHSSNISIQDIKESKNNFYDNQFYQNMFTPCEHVLKDRKYNDNIMDEMNAGSYKDINKNYPFENDLRNTSNDDNSPHNNNDVHRDRITTNDQTDDKTHDQRDDKIHDQTDDKTHDQRDDKTHDQRDDKTHDQRDDKTHDQRDDKTHDQRDDKTHDQRDEKTHDQRDDKTHDQRDEKTHDQKHDEVYENKVQMHISKNEEDVNITCVDTKNKKNIRENKINYSDGIIKKELSSSNCALKKDAKINNSNGEISNLFNSIMLNNVMDDNVKKSYTISNAPCAETCEKLKGSKTFYTKNSTMKENCLNNLLNASNTVMLNEKKFDSHRRESIESIKEHKRYAHYLSNDMHNDSNRDMHNYEHDNNEGNKHILLEILSFYHRCKYKLNFLLLEEYNYLNSMRDYLRKNINTDVKMKIDDTTKEGFTQECDGDDKILINELLYQINGCMSEGNKLYDSHDEGDVLTNKIRKNGGKECKEHIFHEIHKDKTNLHKICIQTDKRIKRIEDYLNKTKKGHLEKKSGMVLKNEIPFAKSTSNGCMKKKGVQFFKGNSINNTDYPFRHGHITNFIRNEGEKNDIIRKKKNKFLHRGYSILTNSLNKKAFISSIARNKIRVRKSGSFKNHHSGEIYLKYKSAYLMKLSKYFLQNSRQLYTKYSISPNYLLRNLEYASTNIFHFYNKKKLHLKRFFDFFSYNKHVSYMKTHTCYYDILYDKKKGDFCKKFKNSSQLFIKPYYEQEDKFDQNANKKYLHFIDDNGITKNNSSNKNIHVDKKKKTRKNLNRNTSQDAHNMYVTRTNSEFSNSSDSAYCEDDCFSPTKVSTDMEIKHYNNNISCTVDKDNTKKMNDNITFANLRSNQDNNPSVCNSMSRGKCSWSGKITYDNSTYILGNSKYTNTQSEYNIPKKGKNRHHKNICINNITDNTKMYLNKENPYFKNLNLVNEKEKYEHIYDDTTRIKSFIHSSKCINSLDIINDFTLNDNNAPEENKFFTNFDIKPNNHIEDTKEKNFQIQDKTEHIVNSIRLKHTNNYFNMYNKGKNEGRKHSENFDLHNDLDNSSMNSKRIYKIDHIARKECCINIYENNYDADDSAKRRKNMDQLNCSYDKIVNSLCNSRGMMVQRNFETGKNCKKREKSENQGESKKYEKSENHEESEEQEKKAKVEEHEAGKNGNHKLFKPWIDNFNEYGEHSMGSNDIRRCNDKHRIEEKKVNNIQCKKFNTLELDNTATDDSLNSCAMYVITNNYDYSCNKGEKLKKTKQCNTNTLYNETVTNENDIAQENATWIEKETRKGNPLQKKFISGRIHNMQIQEIEKDHNDYLRKSENIVSSMELSTPNVEGHVLRNTALDEINFNHEKENCDKNEHLNFIKNENYNSYCDMMDTLGNMVKEENYEMFNEHKSDSEKELTKRDKNLKTYDYNLDEQTCFSNFLSANTEGNYFGIPQDKKHNLRKLKCDISELLYTDTSPLCSLHINDLQKSESDEKEYIKKKRDISHAYKNKGSCKTLSNDDNTTHTKYKGKINSFNKNHFKYLLSNNELSHNFNLTNENWNLSEKSNSNYVSHKIVNTKKLDQIIEKIRKWNEYISNNVNYIQCAFCDKYLFKLENYTYSDILNLSKNESIMKEKYTCSICKHKIKMLNKYNNDLKFRMEKSKKNREGFEDELNDSKKDIHNYKENCIIEYLKKENLDNSSKTNCSGTNTLINPIQKNESLNNNIVQKVEIPNRRNESEIFYFPTNCNNDYIPCSLKSDSEKDESLFQNRNLCDSGNFTIFYDTTSNGKHDNNMNSSLLHFPNVYSTSSIANRSTNDNSEDVLNEKGENDIKCDSITGYPTNNNINDRMSYPQVEENKNHLKSITELKNAFCNYKNVANNGSSNCSRRRMCDMYYLGTDHMISNVRNNPSLNKNDVHYIYDNNDIFNVNTNEHNFRTDYNKIISKEAIGDHMDKSFLNVFNTNSEDNEMVEQERGKLCTLNEIPDHKFEHIYNSHMARMKQTSKVIYDRENTNENRDKTKDENCTNDKGSNVEKKKKKKRDKIKRHEKEVM